MICTGGATFYGRFFACDKRHGPVDILHAIPFSCDTYYYTLAERLGIEKIAYWAHKVGIGQKTGIDLPGEVSGIMPSEEWKMKTFHEKWYAGEVISVGIGQGAVAHQPFQLVRAIAGIASGGVLKRPHVVEPDQLPAEYRQAMYDSYPGSGDVTMPHRVRQSGRPSPTAWRLDRPPSAAGCTASAVSFGKYRLCRQNRHGAGGEPQRRNEESWHRCGARLMPGLWDRPAPQSGYRRGSPGGTRRLGSGGVCPSGCAGHRSLCGQAAPSDNNLQEAQVPAKVEVGAVWSEKPEGSARGRANVTTAAVKKPTAGLELPVGPLAYARRLEPARWQHYQAAVTLRREKGIYAAIYLIS